MWILVVTVIVGGAILFVQLRRKRPQQQVSDERIQLTKDRAARQLADIATSIERQGADTRSTLEHKEFVLEILYGQRAMIQRIYDDCDRVQRDRRTGKQ